MSTIKIGGKEVDAQEFRNDWALALMNRGIIVDLEIKRWRATAKIEAQDLGLQFVDEETQDFVKKYIRLGSEKLLPPQISKEISAIELAARKCLENHSFDTVWGKFVPYNAFESWATENDIIKADFDEYVKTFCLKYDEIVHIISTEYRKMGRDVWKRTRPKDGEPPEPYLTEFVNNVVAKIPPKMDIAALFSYQVIFFTIPLPSIIQANISAAKEIELETEKKVFDASLEMRTKQRIAEEYMAKKTELIDGFLNATVDSMRKYVEDLCQDVLDAMGRSKSQDLTLKQQEKIVGMIDKVKMLNFYNDAEIEKLLSELRFETMKVKGERNKDTIVNKLQKIVSVANEEFMPKDFNPAIDFLEL